MPVPSSLADLSTTAASNSPAGTDAIGTSLDDYLRTTQALLKQSVSRGTDIASGSSITIPTNGNYCVVTGTTTINSIADSWNGRVVTLKFSGALTLTHSASLILPAGENITTSAGDCLQLINESTGVWRCVSLNSNSIPFIQSGTGAVDRTTQDKLRDVVNVSDFGAVGDGVSDDTVAIQAAIDALSGNQTLHIDGNHKISATLTVTDKTNIEISGKGALFLSGAASDAQILKYVGTCTNVEVSGITLTGENNAAYYQRGIGCDTGQTIVNCRIIDTTIQNVNVGIAFNADVDSGGGTVTNCHFVGNRITNIVGTATGQGYGINLTNNTYTVVSRNIINLCQRHSIYQAKGISHNVISDNVIYGHRSGVATAQNFAAINVLRSASVTVANNKLINCSDGGITVSHDTSQGYNCYDISVIGNTFWDRQNVIQDLLIGEEAVPGSYKTYAVSVKGNRFYQTSSGSSGAAVRVFNGTYIDISENDFYATNDAFNAVRLGNTGTSTSDSDINNIRVSNNTFYSAGATYAAVNICPILCTGASYYDVTNNQVSGFLSEIGYESTDSNKNKKISGFLFGSNPTFRAVNTLNGGAGTYTGGTVLGGYEFYTQDASGIGARTVGYARWVSESSAGDTTPSCAIVFGTAATNGAVSTKVRIGSTGGFQPEDDNAQTLGKSSNRWSVVYAGTGTINTSDEREKQDIAALDESEKRVAIALKGLVKKFRFKDAVAAKGENARIHVGVIAQEVIAAFQSENLDPMRYGIICYDEWAETPDRSAGNRYGVRYEELLAFIISAI